MRQAATCVAVVCLALFGCRIPTPIAAGLFTQSEGRVAPTAADCERCHQEIYREWRSSLHAHAWENPAFQTASAGGRASECVSCHAAAPVASATPVMLRALHRDEGVTCITCHLSTNPDAAPLTMRGPVSRTSPIEVHPVIEGDPFYLSSELCGTCHVGPYQEWLEAAPAGEQAGKQTCQGCHMPAVRRKVESVHDEHAYSAIPVAFGDELELRKHTFDVVDDPGGDLVLAVEEERSGADSALRVTVVNRLLHAIPTGDFGRRELRLRAAWPGGAVEAHRVAALGQSIPAGGRWEVRLALPADVSLEQVEVRLERWHRGSDGWRSLARVPGASFAGSPTGFRKTAGR
jgi:nitrate/TMAO reductase-like tetraheme cytochrome c subunit